MDKPRIFLGSSGKQAELIEALTRGLEDVALVEPWTTIHAGGEAVMEFGDAQRELTAACVRGAGGLFRRI